MIDDWLYAASVQELLRTGHLHIAPLSAVYPVVQILWGALFCRLFGFSFTALRASTMVLSATGACAMYALLREVGRGPAISLAAALTLALSPTYFLLSSSFMTDASFCALVVLSLFGLVSGLQRTSRARWWCGAVAAVAAFLVRPLAIALPVAAIVGLWRARRLTTRWLAGPLIALAIMIALQVLLPALLGPLDVEQARTSNMQYVLMVTAREYATWNMHVLWEAAFPIAPLVVAALASRAAVVRVLAASCALAAVLWVVRVPPPMPLPDNQTWSLRDLSARTLVGCPEVPRAPWAARAAPVASVLGLVVVAGLVCAAIAAVQSSDGAAGTGAILVAFGVLQWAIVNLLWLYNDRYYVVFGPTLAYVATSVKPARASLSAPLLAVWAIVAVSGARDTLAFNDTVNAAVAALERAGVAPAEIDGGWASNGWRLYAHPENLPPGADRTYDVPFVTGGGATTYVIANCPLRGYQVERILPLPATTWQGTDRLYVLQRAQPGT